MISDATLAQIMFWLFIAACCLASYLQLRADHWKHLFESTGEAVFRRYVKWYFERMTDEDVLRCVPARAAARQNPFHFYRRRVAFSLRPEVNEIPFLM